MSQVSTALSVLAFLLGLIALFLAWRGKRDLALTLSFVGLFEGYLGLITKVM
jgi:hypothetical protein